MNLTEWKKVVTGEVSEEPSAEEIHVEIEAMIGEGKFSLRQLNEVVWALSRNPDLMANLFDLARRDYADYAREMKSCNRDVLSK